MSVFCKPNIIKTGLALSSLPWSRLITMWPCPFVGTHCDKAVRFDLVNPEALFHHCARSVQQLFELAQSERSNLWTPGGRAVQLTEKELDLSR